MQNQTLPPLLPVLKVVPKLVPTTLGSSVSRTLPPLIPVIQELPALTPVPQELPALITVPRQDPFLQQVTPEVVLIEAEASVQDQAVNENPYTCDLKKGDWVLIESRAEDMVSELFGDTRDDYIRGPGWDESMSTFINDGTPRRIDRVNPHTPSWYEIEDWTWTRGCLRKVAAPTEGLQEASGGSTTPSTEPVATTPASTPDMASESVLSGDCYLTLAGLVDTDKVFVAGVSSSLLREKKVISIEVAKQIAFSMRDLVDDVDDWVELIESADRFDVVRSAGAREGAKAVAHDMFVSRHVGPSSIDEGEEVIHYELVPRIWAVTLKVSGTDLLDLTKYADCLSFHGY